MKSIRFRLLIAALAVLLGTAIAKSQTAAMLPRRLRCTATNSACGEPMMGFFAKELNLTDDQKTQMKAIMQKEHPTMKPLHPAAAPDRSAASPVRRRRFR